MCVLFCSTIRIAQVEHLLVRSWAFSMGTMIGLISSYCVATHKCRDVISLMQPFTFALINGQTGIC